jgi:hypothetical protein
MHVFQERVGGDHPIGSAARPDHGGFITETDAQAGVASRSEGAKYPFDQLLFTDHQYSCKERIRYALIMCIANIRVHYGRNAWDDARRKKWLTLPWSEFRLRRVSDQHTRSKQLVDVKFAVTGRAARPFVRLAGFETEVFR